MRAIHSLLWLACLTCAPAVWGHGIRTERVEGGLGLRVLYDDGHPMAHAEVLVHAPGDPDAVYQEGYTDAEGFFLFYPAQPGVWRLVVDDGLGHRTTQTWEIGAGAVHALVQPGRHSHWWEILLGLGLIMGLYALYARWRSRRGAL